MTTVSLITKRLKIARMKIVHFTLLVWLALMMESALGLVPVDHFTTSRTSHFQLSASSSSSSSSSSSPSESSRRQWLNNIVTIAGAGCLFPNLPANAADIVKAASVCDPSVSVWTRNGRIVYLLGTAHISQSSAELAGNLVKDTHPSGVFVELDPKRVRGSGILAKRVTIDENGQEVEQSGPTSRVIVPDIQKLSTAQTQQTQSESGSTAIVAQATAAAAAVPASKPNPMMRAASVAVGNSIKGMYKKLDSAGFNAGEEFVVAIREGQLQGSDIVLGDRDVEVTLRRVAEALAQSDLNALMKPDSELEQSLKELLPSNMSSNPNGDLNDAEFRQEFSDFVEVIKAKENVRKIMGELQRLAPAIYQALVGERDAYMAAGLNGLNELETIVAVVGIAHVDGIETNLRMNGWKPGSMACPTP